MIRTSLTFLTIVVLIGLTIPAVGAPSTVCTYTCSLYEPGMLYSMRSDGSLVRFNLYNNQLLVYPNPAPPGKYTALFRESNNPHLLGLIAVREDGAMYLLPDLSDVWQPLATLPTCDSPVLVAPTTLGNMKAKYR